MTASDTGYASPGASEGTTPKAQIKKICHTDSIAKQVRQFGKYGGDPEHLATAVGRLGRID